MPLYEFRISKNLLLIDRNSILGKFLKYMINRLKY
jgi:hypothetical protein